MIIVPSVEQLESLTAIVTSNLTLRLFGNNVTPDQTFLAVGLNEIAGGGYAAKPLTFANWILSSALPVAAGSQAGYNTSQLWTFTGVINAPGTVYGYYITRDSDGKLIWAERFTSGVPFIPIVGSQIAFTPLLTLINQ